MDKNEMVMNFRSMASKSDRITDEVIDTLDRMGYFDAPASKGHHLAEPGGLVVHSLGVAVCLQTLTQKLGLEWDRDDSPIVIGLLHDLCKCDQYIPHYDTHQVMFGGMTHDLPDYNSTPSYIWNEHQRIAGHGDKSVMLISSLMKLTVEEVMCIRYHMGAFSDDPKERSAYSDAVKCFSNVLWTHTADMWSSQINEV